MDISLEKEKNMKTLSEEIAKYKEEFAHKAPAEVKEVMDAETKKLVKANISKNALKVGDQVANFTLPNAANKLVSLDGILKENDYAVISFYRGAWCPYCNLELRALQRINEDLVALKAELVAISPQTPDVSLSLKEKQELAFEVLSDLHNKVAKAYGLVFFLPPAVQAIYESFGHDIPGSNNDNSYELPMPATYVINKDKKIIFSFVNEDYRKRCEPQDILLAIRENS